MVKRAAALLLLILAACRGPAPEPDRAPGFQALVPIVIKAQGFGIQASDSNVLGRGDDLRAFRPDVLRVSFGRWNDPDRTPFQAYLSGGWPAVDQMVGPTIVAARAISPVLYIDQVYGGSCSAPSQLELAAYASFLYGFADRYDVQILDVWNEVDVTGGLPSLYGCFGLQHQDRLLRFLQQLILPRDTRLAISLAFSGEGSLDLLRALDGLVNIIGVHHYGIYQAGDVLSPWPGGLWEACQLALQNVASSSVWLTEYNLRDPWLAAWESPEFQRAQSDLLHEGLRVGCQPIAFTASKAPDWQATGMLGTLFEREYTGAGP